MDKIRPHQHGVRLPYGYRRAALGLFEALDIASKTYQFWLCPTCNGLSYCDYDPELDDGSMGYTCNQCGWDGSSDDLLLGRTQ